MSAEEFVVFTALTGTRERLGSPFPPNCAGFERICFTDDPTLTSRDWSVVLLDEPRLDPAREALGRSSFLTRLGIENRGSAKDRTSPAILARCSSRLAAASIWRRCMTTPSS